VGAADRHEVTDLSCAPGELSFRARVGGQDRRVRLRAEGGETATGADPVLAACLMPAMRFGGTLTLPGPVSPRVLRSHREYQAVQRAWSLDWEFGEPPFEEVEVIAPTRVPGAPREPGRVAAFFSGGVDSWSTLLDHPEVTDLIFARGFDLIPGKAHHAEVAPEVEAKVREVADELGLTLHVVETDLRELSDPLVLWDAYYASACMAVAHFLAPRFERVLLASGMDHEVDDPPIGSARLIDHLWNSEQLEIVDDGGRYSRAERTRRIADHPLVQRTLRVCWENRGSAYNCGRCRKCLTTMITLEAFGARSAIQTFPPDLPLRNLASFETKQILVLTLWEDVLDAVRGAGRADLEPTVEDVVERSKRGFGLPPSYRRRHLPGPAPLSGIDAPDPPADEHSAAALAEILESHSWRMTAPLRKAGAALRRRRSSS
jgi:hypothetical protein